MNVTYKRSVQAHVAARLDDEQIAVMLEVTNLIAPD